MADTNEIVAKRIKLYGDPVETFVRIAEVWSGILGTHVNPAEVPLMLAGMKLVRTQVSPDYSDNSDDVDGYMEIFRLVVGEDMIHARTPDDYWAQHEQRVQAGVQEAIDLMAADVPDEFEHKPYHCCVHCRERFDVHLRNMGQPARCRRPGFESNTFAPFEPELQS